MAETRILTTEVVAAFCQCMKGLLEYSKYFSSPVVKVFAIVCISEREQRRR